MYGSAEPSAFKYELRTDFTYRGPHAKIHPWSSAVGRPVPDSDWQRAEYKHLMGQEPPGEPDPQFQYNPRTKAGKALLRDLVASYG